MEFTRRNLIGTGALLTAGLLASPRAVLAASPDPYLRFVHPELRPSLQLIAQFTSQMPPLSAATLAQHRAAMGRFARPQLPEVPVEKRVISGARGQPDVTVYVINAKPGGPRGAILHTHGGGFVSGDAAGGIRDLQDLCKVLDCVAVSVDYRLAPETTYAGSIEDNYAGLQWLHANAASLGADPARIAVMGESAGGGHAALLAITARDRGEVPVAFQCLVYPMLDDRTGSARRVPAHVGQLIWTAEANRFGWQSFLGTAPGKSRAPIAVPARLTDLSGLPPAFIGVGSLDLFVDEDVDYAQRLNTAGVGAELLVVPGAFHGFDGIAAGTAIARWFTAAKIEALRGAFAAGRTSN